MKDREAFGQRMTGGYEAPILAEPRGGPIPKWPTSRVPRNHPGHGDQKSHGRKGVRASLAAAGTAAEVGTAASAEAKRITGRDIEFDLMGSDVQVAREHAEGVLQGLERYPDARLNRVQQGADLQTESNRSAAAATYTDTGTIAFTDYAQSQGADAYRATLQRDERNGDIVAGTPEGVALHEFGHIVAEHGAAAMTAEAVTRGRGEAIGQSHDDYVGDHISNYATENRHELAAEAFADVMVHGSDASDASKAIVAVIDESYGAAGGTIRNSLSAGQLSALVTRTRLLNHPGHSSQKSHGRRGDGVAGLPRLGGRESPTEAAKATNPKYGTTGGMDQPVYRNAPVLSTSDRTGKVVSRQYSPDMGPPPSGAYEENCTNVVMAFEMRMRGYDVEAAPMSILDPHGYAGGRTYAETDQQLASHWQAPGGGPHGRSFSGQPWRSFKEIDREVESWPEGGRGYMTTGKHVFSVVKQNGKATYVEAQHDATPTRTVTTEYQRKYADESGARNLEEAKVVRLDDLEPTDAILESVVATGS